MLSIELKQLRFLAHHGIHAEEKQTGAEFEMNVVIHYQVLQPIQQLSDTIDYVTVYHMIAEVMRQPTPLLETLVMQLADAILARFSQAEEVTIQLIKLNAPIAALQGKVAVAYSRKR